MEHIKEFNSLNKSNVSIAGGKGASLGEMTQAGIPVPEGFVVLSNAFEEFIEITGINVEIYAILDKVNIQEMRTVENASEAMQALILNSPIPKPIEKEIIESHRKLNCEFVAVRSSATSEDSASAAWAGQLESYLNTTKENILENVKKCWASLFTPRAIFYRFDQKLNNSKISVAVVVQKMVESEKSGIAFSVHPVTQDYNQLIIEAGFGLGEAIVSGQITPDSYVVDKQDLHTIDINVNEQNKALYRKKGGGNEWKELGEERNKQVLDEKEIIELAELIIKIEKHYGFPVDIEWAYERGKLYILQSRPITTLKKRGEKVTLSKLFSREHSLFYLENWSYSEINHTSRILGGHMNDLIYLSEPGNPQVSSWYNLKENARLFGLVAEKSKDPSFFKWVEKDFDKFWKKIEPYIRKKKKIRCIAELRKFRENVIEFYAPYSAAYVSPEIPQLDEKYRKLSLKLRQDVQESVNDIDEAYLDFFIKKFQEYKEIANYITAEEIFSLEKERFLDEKLKEIEKRKNEGYFLLDNKLYLYPQLKEVLDKKNIELEGYNFLLLENPTIKEKVFTKEHSREYSLFRVASWYDSMNGGLRQIVGKGVDEACAVYRGEDLISIYYETENLQEVFNVIVEKCKDIVYMKKEIEKFLDLFAKLKEYYIGNKKIKNLQELRKVQEMYSLVWAYTAIIYTIPRFPVDESLKQISYKAREETQEYNEASEVLFKDFLEEKYPPLKGKTRFVLPEEVWSGEIEKKDFIDKILQRQNGFIYYKNKIYTGDIEKNLIEFGIKLEDKVSAVSGKAEMSKNEVKGQIAFKGNVRGIVKVVNAFKDISKVDVGDILVTAMTMPKYLPAMKKAAAFVTDEGGITSHAAIVARELKKPCIIGTKIATQVLHDGDLVEVDADKGTIKILQKKEEKIKVKWVKEGEVTLEKDTTVFLLNDILSYPVVSQVEKRTGIEEGVISYIDREEGVNKIYTSQDKKRGEWGFSFFLDDNKFKGYLNEVKEIFVQAEKFRKKIDKINLEKAPLKDIKEIFSEDIKTLWKSKVLVFFAIDPYSWRIEESLKENLQKTVPKEEFESVLGILVLQEERDSLEEERYSWLQEIILPVLEKNIEFSKVKENDYFLKKINEHLNRYRSYSAGFGMKMWGMDYFIKLLEQDLNKSKKELREEFLSLENKTAINKEKKQEVIKKFNLPPELVKKASILGKLANLRLDLRVMSWSFYLHVFIKLLDACSKKAGLSELEINSLTYDEFMSLLKDNFKTNNEIKQKIEERKNTNILQIAYPGEGFRIILGEEAKNRFYNEVGHEKETKNLKSFKGDVACKKGVVRGKVFTFKYGSSDFIERISKFPDGAILVSNLTMPVLMPAIRKAKAMVTDGGGITCHSAIVSRELGIPCIIGTNIATKILKDGDFIEVDTEEGIVRILD